MKYYTNDKFKGVYPTGTAAIVKGRNKEHAAAVLTSELRKVGVEQYEPIKPEDMILWPQHGEQVRILNDVNY